MVQPIPILLYHSIARSCAADYRRWLVLPEEFERQLQVLLEDSYDCLTISELVGLLDSGKDVPPRTAAITFDDGLADFAEGAVPILRRHNFSATLYVVSGLVGSTSRWLAGLGEGNRPMLGWQELRDVAAAGIEIGAHTVSHPEVDVLSAAEAQREIRNSKATLEDKLGLEIRSFAYPHGYSSKTVRKMVAEAGFSSACSVRHALASASENRFALSRIIMTSDIGTTGFREILAGRSLPISPPIDSAKIAGWRAVRKLRRLTRTGERLN
ncbi:MAG: polysaccharide deacetylase family protein [Rhizobiales bacterium]|nr:polysaccharide deacetylase family protein [Hyphomicrobiales bacterium]MBI3672932.1 polysaccharide deacetylase family protein [Hyphomicrobiales bacterium]